MNSDTISLEKDARVSFVVGETTLEMFLQRSQELQACDSPQLSLDEIQKIHIRRVLVSCDGNRRRSAQILGIGRTALYRYLRSHDLTER